jgi:hypothetical protein
MAGWKANLKGLYLPLPIIKGAIDRRVLNSTKEGARVWLTTVLAIVPTWSGASRATFEALAQAVGFTVTYGPITAFKDRRALGQGAGHGGLEKTPGGYSFYYRTDLRYLIFNEANVATVGVAGVFKGLINPTPYKFFEAGERAFKAYSKTVRLPVIKITSKAL